VPVGHLASEWRQWRKRAAGVISAAGAYTAPATIPAGDSIVVTALLRHERWSHPAVGNRVLHSRSCNKGLLCRVAARRRRITPGANDIARPTLLRQPR
jgi:hypothetical protein